ncbi:MAG: alpha-amylase, partial [Erysipelotrichaceae bacterium]|nr:alpha-amylase [Erysipelotrichaceae bacterium]
MKKILLTWMVLLMLLPLSACGKKQEKIEIVDDNYRNVYEIFVASFNDSDGDKVGDLNGVTKKLDYLQEMGYTGIWMMPIHRSPSYHKYDVIDYYSIDPAYGTLEDFEKLTEEAHKRDINIIIDLVVNHTSHLNPWFIQAEDAYAKGTFSPYLNWYNFSHEPQYG